MERENLRRLIERGLDESQSLRSHRIEPCVVSPVVPSLADGRIAVEAMPYCGTAPPSGCEDASAGHARPRKLFKLRSTVYDRIECSAAYGFNSHGPIKLLLRRLHPVSACL